MKDIKDNIYIDKGFHGMEPFVFAKVSYLRLLRALVQILWNIKIFDTSETFF